MSFRKISSVVALMLIAGASLAVADEKLDKIEKEVVAKWKAVKSMTGKMKMTADVNQGGMKMKRTMDATIEYLRKGDKMMSRMEGKMVMIMDMGGQTQNMEMPMLSVSDGDVTHTLVDQMGRKMCVKTKSDANETVGAAMFKSLREKNKLTVKPDEEVNGDKCWVVEATPKEAANPQQPSKMVYYFRQKDGAAVRRTGFDATGAKIITMTTSDIKYNEKIDPARFVFKVPEGVQVMDRTGETP